MVPDLSGLYSSRIAFCKAARQTLHVCLKSFRVPCYLQMVPDVSGLHSSRIEFMKAPKQTFQLNVCLKSFRVPCYLQMFPDVSDPHCTRIEFIKAPKQTFPLMSAWSPSRYRVAYKWSLTYPVTAALVLRSVRHPDRHFMSAWSPSGRHVAFIPASNYYAHSVIPTLIVGNELATQWRHQSHRTNGCTRDTNMTRSAQCVPLYLTDVTRSSLSFVVVLHLISVMHMEAFDSRLCSVGCHCYCPVPWGKSSCIV
jgi:hypothetical protein